MKIADFIILALFASIFVACGIWIRDLGKPSKPSQASIELQARMERMATSIAPVAIDASLIPRELLDRDLLKRRIKGQLENKLGSEWTVEVICFPQWCKIKLRSASYDIDIDANNGSVEKSVYAKNRYRMN